MLDHDSRDTASGLVELALHGDPRDHFVVADTTSLLRENRDIVRIPHGENVALVDRTTISNGQNRTNDDLVDFDFAIVFIQNLDGASLVENDVCAISSLHDAEATVLNLTTDADLNFRILKHTTRNTTDVECSHRQLCARLTNRLSGDDTNCRTTFNHGVCRRIDAVFECSDADLLTSGE